MLYYMTGALDIEIACSQVVGIVEGNIFTDVRGGSTSSSCYAIPIKTSIGALQRGARSCQYAALSVEADTQGSMI